MARERTKVPAKTKRELIREAGNKCANPGCPNRRTEFHHIRQWAVYETHDARHMIAICPACHDAVHHGSLKIDDETIYRWKAIKRRTSSSDLIFVEPGPNPTLLLGRSAYYGSTEVMVFELNKANKLGFRIEGDDIFLANLVVTDRSGRELIRITDNRVRHFVGEPVSYDRRQGRLRLTAPAGPDFLPEGILTYLREQEPSLIENERLVLLDLEVVESAKVRIQGIWIKDEIAYDDGLMIISKERIHQITPNGVFLVSDNDFLQFTPDPGVDSYLLPFDNVYFGFGVIDTANHDSVNLCERAKALENAGDRDGAIQKYKEATALHPVSPTAYSQLCRLLCERGDVEAAFEAGKKFLFHSQDRSPAFNNLGLVLLAKGNLAGAIDHFRQAIALKPGYAMAYNNLGKVLAQDGKIDEAMEQIQKAINLDGNNAGFHNDMGVVLAAKGDVMAAIEKYEYAIKLDPQCEFAKANLEPLTKLVATKHKE